jgi:hypothetical protein
MTDEISPDTTNNENGIMLPGALPSTFLYKHKPDSVLAKSACKT